MCIVLGPSGIGDNQGPSPFLEFSPREKDCVGLGGNSRVLRAQLPPAAHHEQNLYYLGL
jgi:hypothetical protein